jgi:hypothetical protein
MVSAPPRHEPARHPSPGVDASARLGRLRGRAGWPRAFPGILDPTNPTDPTRDPDRTVRRSRRFPPTLAPRSGPCSARRTDGSPPARKPGCLARPGPPCSRATRPDGESAHPLAGRCPPRRRSLPPLPAPESGSSITRTAPRRQSYLRAALQAMGASVVSNEAPSLDLPARFRPAALASGGTRTARRANRPGRTRTRRNPGSSPAGSRSVPKPSRLRQRVAPGPGAPVFRDSHGDPWLTEERQGSGSLARRLPVSPRLDRLAAGGRLSRLVAGAPSTGSPRHHGDRTGTGHAPVRPTPPGSRLHAPTPAPIDLRAGCWLLGAALFLVERLLSRLADPAPGSAPPIASGAS